MTTTATDLRKSLFHTLDVALRGEPVVITYKGAQVRLVAEGGGSKLARAVRRNALRVDPDSIVSSDADLMSTLNSKWADEDSHL